jgi:hypothetical protein
MVCLASILHIQIDDGPTGSGVDPDKVVCTFSQQFKGEYLSLSLSLSPLSLLISLSLLCASNYPNASPLLSNLPGSSRYCLLIKNYRGFHGTVTEMLVQPVAN